MPLQGEASHKPTYLNLTPVVQGASQVHRAYHQVYGRPIVQKTVPAAALLPDSVARGEPEILLEIDHAAIPRIHEAQYEPTRPGFITFVMDDVGDFDADEVVLGRRPRPSVGEAAGIGMQLLSALEYIHVVNGLVHRDIKPDNIRLSSDMTEAWLIDFNYAGRLGSQRTVVGAQTPFAWMAPEVPIKGRYGIPSELYALGIVLYELICGRMMAAGYPAERQEDRVSSGERAFPNSHFKRWPPETPASVRKVITKAFAADPSKRWQTATEMRQALGRCVYVDWRKDPSTDGRWVGSWPSSRVPSQRVEVEVVTRLLKAGKDRGRTRALARYRPAATWRRLPGLADHLVESDSKLRHFFDDVERRLARIRPAS